MTYERAWPDRFWNKVDQGKEDECWEWNAARTSTGYGTIAINRKLTPAHRVSFELAYGSIPTGLFVLHRCDNRPCVNPSHLFLGTQSDNLQDACDKGRKHPPTPGTQKLDEDAVREIRRLYKKWSPSSRELAQRFGVAMNTICDIARGRTWRHVS